MSQVNEFEQVFNELKVFIENNDISHINTPVSVGMFISGKMYLSYSLSTSRVTVKDLSEAVFYIKNFLKEVKKK